ncbi:hypothetical protein E3N88_25921 [Mikania micrantha]|uniref:BED-type domain-containing protein n=1 Tax=Mikania micrantha TaxID=192012 RepID=A0A5N6N724_9ASTR|nr:hypothetical protein E3N88_25921 [Mikania micrantha]
MASSSANSSVGCGDSTNLEVVEIIHTKRNPEIWKNYDLCKMSSGPNKACCKLCGSFFKHDANTTLKNHHEFKYCKALKNEASRGQPTMSNDGSIFAYSVDAVREQMAQFVIQQSLPFNHFDNPRLTRLIQQTLQPCYSHSRPSRSIELNNNDRNLASSTQLVDTMDIECSSIDTKFFQISSPLRPYKTLIQHVPRVPRLFSCTSYGF